MAKIKRLNKHSLLDLIAALDEANGTLLKQQSLLILKMILLNLFKLHTNEVKIPRFQSYIYPGNLFQQPKMIINCLRFFLKTNAKVTLYTEIRP